MENLLIIFANNFRCQAAAILVSVAAIREIAFVHPEDGMMILSEEFRLIYVITSSRPGRMLSPLLLRFVLVSFQCLDDGGGLSDIRRHV